MICYVCGTDRAVKGKVSCKTCRKLVKRIKRTIGAVVSRRRAQVGISAAVLSDVLIKCVHTAFYNKELEDI